MLSSALEVSKAWSTGLNRLGWGCTSALMLFWGLGNSVIPIFDREKGTDISEHTLVAVLLLLLASAVVGSMVISLGSLAERSKMTLSRRLLLAERIGRLNNSLLAHHYGDATLRYEMAAGVKGTLMIGAFAVFNRWLSGSFPAGNGSLDSGPSFSWPIMAGILFAFFFDWLLNRSSSEAFEALEEAVRVSESRDSVGAAP
jgi:hypothetical protein